MLDKEVLDYIKVQRSLGVKESSIKKSLVDAGYDAGEVTEGLKKIPKKNGWDLPQIQISNNVLLSINVIIAILVILVVFYSAKVQNDKLDAIEAEKYVALEELNKTLSAKYTELAENIDLINEQLSSQITVNNKVRDDADSALRTTLQEYRYDSLRRDAAISDSLMDISNKSFSQLSAVQAEFENIKDSTSDFSNIIPRATEAVVLVGEKDVSRGIFSAVGSGVFINSVGYIVTNEHVIDELKTITVRKSNGIEYTAKLIDSDPELDVALIKLNTDKTGFTYLDWGDSDKVYVGQHVIAVGSPIGFESTVTEGIISNVKRRVSGSSAYYLQTDVAINKGNSGGPLIDKNGDIIGIATRKILEEGYEGLGFALRSNDVKNRIQTMLYESEN